MINNEPIDQPHVYPQPDHEREIPQKSFLPILFLILVAYYSFTYNPATPVVTVTTTTTAIQISDYIISSDNSIVSFTFSFRAIVTNPSRDVFSYKSTYAYLLYDSQVVGYMFIPGRRVTAGMENEMAVSMFVKSVPISVVRYVPAKFGTGKLRPAMELKLRMILVGRKTVLWIFSRQVVCLVERRADIDVFDGSTLDLPLSA